MVLIDGYIGNDPEFRTAARLFVEAANANIAGMQKQLYFGPPEDGLKHFGEPSWSGLRRGHDIQRT